MSVIERERLEAYLAQREAAGPRGITPRAPGADAPLSFAQQQIWLHAQLAPELPLYNEPFTIRRLGPLDVAALEAALSEIVRRHEAWRTTVRADGGQPIQVIHAPSPIRLPLVDLTGTPAAAREAEATRLATADACRPFDLERGPLVRGLLVRVDDEDHRLFLTVHHIVLDGVSIYQVLLAELGMLYEAFAAGQPSPLPDLPVQYADFALWQREQLRTESPEASLAYWRRRLAGLPALAMPTDTPRPAVQTFGGARRRLALSPALSAAVRALARREGTSLFMTLLAAFEVVLHRYTGQDDLALGTVSAGRGQPEVERLLGVFANPVCVRADVGRDPTFSELLARVREESLEALAHDDVPFESLVKALGVERDAGRNPLFQVAFSLEAPRAPVTGWDAGHLDVDTGTSKFDLYLELDERPEAIVGRIVYCTDLFRPETIERFARHYERVLESVVANPRQRLSEVQLLDEAERRQLMAWSVATAAYPDTATVHALFETQAARTPEAIALIEGDRRLTYRELDERANQLAARLRRRGVGPDVPVGVFLDRSLDTIVAFLGILKAGGAYLPLDPAYPPERRRFMLDDAGVRVAITSAVLRERLREPAVEVVLVDVPEAVASGRTPAVAATGPDHLACIIFTSGSTGRPKGVAVPHRGIVRLLFGQTFARLDATRTVLLVSTLSFDASTFEVWGALLHGGRCVIHPAGVPTVERIAALVRAHRITTVWLTASLFNAVIDEGADALRGVAEVLTGGETLSAVHVRRAQQALPGTTLINGYGPTECTTFACCNRLTAPLPPEAGSVPIGPPIANTEAFVLDVHGRLAPVGAVGELYLGGPGLARGYVNRPDITGERFVRHPFDTTPGARLYRTGDLVRWRADGALDFVGRADGQVKIRGFRIELGEIEAVLADHPAVREVVVVVSERAPGDRVLIAYVVPRGAMPRPERLRQHLRTRLPAFMVPSAFVEIPSVPLTPAGKVDRAALPAPARTTAAARLAPRDPLEARLLALWQDVLGVRDIGVKDDFFALGGHSLVAVRLMRQIERAFGQALPLNVLYTHPTVEDVARVLLQREHGRVRLPVQRFNEGGRRRPIFFFHGDLNGAGFYCRELASHLGPEQPVYAIHPLGLDGGPVPATIEAMAAAHLRLVREMQPHGPYRLGGYCNGALVAYEVACRLAESGERVEPVILVAAAADTRLRALKPLTDRLARALGLGVEAAADYFSRVRYLADRLAGASWRTRLGLGLAAASKLAREVLARLRGMPPALFDRTPIPADAGTAVRVADELLNHETYARYFTAAMAYVPRPFAGRLLVFWPDEQIPRQPRDSMLGWSRLAQHVQVVRVAGDHHTVVTRHANLIARTLQARADADDDATDHAA
jgi:amino acid adenylation domain-containing protein